MSEKLVFTLGRKDIYEPLFDLKEIPQKASGGSVWETYEEAKEYRQSMFKKDAFNIYGVVCDWDKDTEIVEKES